MAKTAPKLMFWCSINFYSMSWFLLIQKNWHDEVNSLGIAIIILEKFLRKRSGIAKSFGRCCLSTHLILRIFFSRCPSSQYSKYLPDCQTPHPRLKELNWQVTIAINHHVTCNTEKDFNQHKSSSTCKRRSRESPRSELKDTFPTKSQEFFLFKGKIRNDHTWTFTTCRQ